MNRSDKLGNWTQAMLAVQHAMPVLKTTRDVQAGTHRYSYAEWDKLVPVVLPILNASGFVVIQAPKDAPNRVVVETVIQHISDEWCSGDFGIDMPVNANAQAYGSALSYAKRYGLLSMIFAVVGDEDDDAAKASAARDRNIGNGFSREDRARKLAQTEIASCMTTAALEEWWQENKDGINELNMDVVQEIMGCVSARHKVLNGGPAAAPAAPKAPASVPPTLPKAPAAPRAPAPIPQTPAAQPAALKAPVAPVASQTPKPPLTLSKAPAAPTSTEPVDDFAGFGDNFPS